MSTIPKKKTEQKPTNAEWNVKPWHLAAESCNAARFQNVQMLPSGVGEINCEIFFSWKTNCNAWKPANNELALASSEQWATPAREWTRWNGFDRQRVLRSSRHFAPGVFKKTSHFVSHITALQDGSDGLQKREQQQQQRRQGVSVSVSHCHHDCKYCLQIQPFIQQKKKSIGNPILSGATSWFSQICELRTSALWSVVVRDHVSEGTDPSD